MARPVSHSVEKQWGPEVEAFAKQKGVQEYLLPILEMTKRVIPSIRSLELFLEVDPEIPNEHTIAYRVEVAGLSLEQAVESRWEWCAQLPNCYPQPWRVCPFVLDMELVEK